MSGIFNTHGQVHATVNPKKPEGKIPLGRPRFIFEDNAIWILKTDV
jgi:hypothetical protein